MTNPKRERRVVVTGAGAVSPVGLTVDETWRGLVEGQSGIKPITLFDASRFPTRIAGEVKGFDSAAALRRFNLPSEAGRATGFALAAAAEAMDSARASELQSDRSRFGIYFGAGDSGHDFPSFASTVTSVLNETRNGVNAALYVKASEKYMNGVRELENQPFMTVTHLANYFRLRGPVGNCLTACAASSQAVGEAWEIIRRGDADVMMTGGSHSMLYPLGIAGFSLLTALSRHNEEPEKASRPFDKKRAGFVLSEGAGVLILEELSHALQRGANILGEITGYGSTSDAYRLTDMDPEGRGACRAVQRAMEKAGIGPEDVDYISAHGTGTKVNDMIETRVIHQTLGSRAPNTPVSSIKSVIGHTIAAAGALELIACLKVLEEGLLPPTINYEEKDPDCDLDYVPNVSRKTGAKVILSHSFGFGGQNICLAVKSYDE